MYNYSRLCQIWAAYVKGVMKNDYERLPDINAINFGLLTKNVSLALRKLIAVLIDNLLFM